MMRKTLSTIPLSPFLNRKGDRIVSEGHPFDVLRAGSQTPSKGASPLCTRYYSSACWGIGGYTSLEPRGMGN